MKGNILIVDDTPENLQVLSATLSREGYKVRGVINGFMALRVAQSGTIDLILLDIKMPDITGYEVCEQLKADPQTEKIPVIFISALDDALDKVRAFQIGGSDYITKPFQVPEVLARVENQLTIRHLQQEREEQNRKLKQEIDERKKAELSAERALRAKSEFLTNMSHELRTPLNVILGFTQLMSKDTEIEDEQLENLNIITRSGEHLLSLINDILDLSKIESGAIVFQENAFDLYQLLDNLEAMFLLAAERKGIRLNFAIANDVPHYIKTDEKKLRSCLINLLNNAIKFTDTGSVTLRVSNQSRSIPQPPDPDPLPSPLPRGGVQEEECKRGATNNQQPITNNQIYFAVEDTGCGIATEEIDRLFEAFVQAEAGRKAVEGTGLGLTITRQFITLMGGEISVRSNVGEGSVFEFYLVSSIVETLPDSKTPKQRVVGLQDPAIAYRILVVDDTRENCLLLTKLLRPIGFDVREARNGKEAIAIWETWFPHLILMDTRMPIANGYEATREIRKREKMAANNSSRPNLRGTQPILQLRPVQATNTSTYFDDAQYKSPSAGNQHFDFAAAEPVEVQCRQPTTNNQQRCDPASAQDASGQTPRRRKSQGNADQERERAPRQPTIIIALTASIFEEQRGTMIEAGCDDFIHKPFQEATLLDKIAIHLGISYRFEDLVTTEQFNRTSSFAERSERFFLSELQKMPLIWVKNFHRYAREINEEATLKAIEETSDRAPTLGVELRNLYEDSRFDILVRIAEKFMESCDK
ncbi:MAG: response regulator [Cyanobacteria bacterium P01_E01_bin.42]